MALELIKTTKDHPGIKYMDFKYSRPLKKKSGEIIWRCTNKNCSSSIVTDGLKSKVIGDPSVHNHSVPPSNTQKRMSSKRVNAVEHVTVSPSVLDDFAGVASVDVSSLSLAPNEKDISPGRYSDMSCTMSCSTPTNKLSDRKSKELIISGVNTNEFSTYDKTYVKKLLLTRQVTDIELYILSLKNFISRHKDIEIILSTIPYRYDLRESSTENTLIREANIQISKLCRTESIKLIDLWTLPRRFHTNHGLHFNKIGKSHIVREIRAFLRADCLTINERNIEVQTLNLNSSDPIDSVKASDLSTQKKQSLTNYNSSEIINQGLSSREDINNDFPSVDNNSSLVTNNCQVTCAISSHTTSLNSLVLERELIT